MPQTLSVGDEAPNFDLASTEDAVLSLRDEVPRLAVLLYFFVDPASERVRRDLRELAEGQRRLAERRATVLAVSPAKVEALKELQRELGLRFPLLSDDRAFSAAYGVIAEGGDEAPVPALYLVGRDQTILWMENPAPPVGTALAGVDRALAALAPGVANYPSAVVNRVVDWWVNRLRGVRAG